MVREILSEYNINQEHITFQPINNGLINQTWLVNNSSTNYILQKINHNIFRNPDAIAQNVRMIADYFFLHNPGYLFVSPVKTKSGEEMIFLEDAGYYRLFPFIKKSHTINTVENPTQAYEAAAKFGEFTKLLSGFPVEKLQTTLPDFHNLSLRYQQFCEALQNGNAERIKKSKELIDFIIANNEIVNTYESILKNPSFKLRVTHHDTKISNVLFDGNDKGLCVIDLDTVMPGYFISDVGDMIRTYLSPVNEEEKDFSKIEIREAYFTSIWKGYMNEMNDELSDAEKDHFIYAGKFMIYMQAIRFLADYLNNDVYYGAKYEDQNYVRTGNQVTLLRLLIEREELLQALVSDK